MFFNRMPLRRAIVIPFAFLCASLLSSCGFTAYDHPGCELIQTIPLTPLSSQASQTVFETPGTIITIHGSGSATLNSGNAARAIKVEQSVKVPAYANQATVFLNGWRLSYLKGDQHVFGLGTVIARIRIAVDASTREKTLTWNAFGVLRDSDGKEGYSWNYNFTVVAWNDGNIKAALDQGVADQNGGCPPQGVRAENFSYERPLPVNTALSSVFSFIESKIFTAGTGTAVLPRGFGFHWWDFSVFDHLLESFPDHHFRQAAYNLDHSEVFVDDKKVYNIGSSRQHAPITAGASFSGSGFLSWNSYALFKDDDTRRDYGFGEVVSGVAGADVGVIQPPFSILQVDNGGWFCGSLASPEVRTEEFVIREIPFEYAIPMMTGWNLEYLCSDQHVKSIGIGISRWSYQPATGGAGGTLRYTVSSTLSDDDNQPDFSASHKVTILGFRPVSGVRPSSQINIQGPTPGSPENQR